jgi:hypothetical protein
VDADGGSWRLRIEGACWVMGAMDEVATRVDSGWTRLGTAGFVSLVSGGDAGDWTRHDTEGFASVRLFGGTGGWGKARGFV